MRRFLWVVIAMLAPGCSSGAVVFAPTPMPPDLSPVRYEHPSGVFSLLAPRNWSVYTQNTTTLATAAFSPPESAEPLLTVAVINLNQQLNPSAFSDTLNRYQSQVRPDLSRYTEQNRQAMGDGSWRLTGLRTTESGATQQVNTFVEQSENYLGIIDVIIPDDATRTADLQSVVNTFKINSEAALQPAELSALVSVSNTGLDIVHLLAWTTPGGVFFITGEIANNSSTIVTDMPVRALLFTQDGLAVAEAVDTPMGYGLLPGEFAPFSLRFGQGQPALSTTFEVMLGNDEWLPDDSTVIYGTRDMTWTDESTFNDNGQLVIDGTVTNTGTRTIRQPRAIVTVFDNNQNVIAAGFSDLASSQLAPGDSAHYQIVVAEMGGEPAQYIVNVQGTP